VKILRIPIKVEISFFAIAVFLGLGRSRELTLVAEWIAVVFVSVLLHEFGHALMARAFGLKPEIRLYQMGGLTSWRSEKEVAPLKHLAISLAGPFTGFALGACVLLLGPPFLRAVPGDLAVTIYFDLLWVNIGWGIFNLLPMLPLDGGQVLVTLEAWLLKRKDRIVSHALSLLVAVAIALAAFYFRQLWIGFLAIFFAYLNGSVLFKLFQIHRDRKLRDSLDQIRSLIEQDEFAAALELSARVRATAKSAELKQAAARLAVIGYLRQAKLEQAEEELRRYTIFFGGDSYLQGALHFLKGEPALALPHVKAAFEYYPEPEVGKMLYKTLVLTGDFAGALDLCRNPAMTNVSWELSVDLQTEAFNRGAFKASAEAGIYACEQKADPKVAYNVACAYARDAEFTEALTWMKRAIDLGFEDKTALVSDPDLAALRSLPEFGALLAKFDERTG
jgi:Zn-dependent protease